jgi:antirestriction protein ArdC
LAHAKESLRAFDRASQKGKELAAKAAYEAMLKRAVEEILKELEEGVRNVYTSGKYDEYLRLMSKFHRYSTSNNILISMQRDNCTMLAGYQSWKKNFGRAVKKGEKGIRIIVPFVAMEKRLEPKKKDASGSRADGEALYNEVESMRMKFKAAYVFDVSQTEGKPLPSIMEPTVGSVEDYECMLDAMRMVSRVPVVYEEMEGEAEGLYYFDDRIAIKNGMNEARTISALAHEMAHSFLHKRPENDAARDKMYRLGEVQAESVAYTFCQYFGIDTKCNSFGYIVDWSADKSLKDLRESLELIRTTASALITLVESKMAELRPNDKWKSGDLSEVYMGKMAVRWR